MRVSNNESGSFRSDSTTHTCVYLILTNDTPRRNSIVNYPRKNIINLFSHLTMFFHVDEICPDFCTFMFMVNVNFSTELTFTVGH